MTAPWVNYAPQQPSVVILLLWAFSTATIEESGTLTVTALLFYCQRLKRRVKEKHADVCGEV